MKFELGFCSGWGQKVMVQVRSWGGGVQELEPIPADFMREAGHILDAAPTQDRATCITCIVPTGRIQTRNLLIVIAVLTAAPSSSSIPRNIPITGNPHKDRNTTVCVCMCALHVCLRSCSRRYLLNRVKTSQSRVSWFTCPDRAVMR